MAQNLSSAQIQRTMKHAKVWIEKHKAGIGEVVKAGEASGLPFIIGLAEGRLANDGSGHVAVAGAPVMLLAAGLGTVGAASGYLDEYGTHVGNAAAGCWGAFAADAGRQIGLKMRAVAGKNIQSALLTRAALDEVNAKLAKKNMTLKEAPVGGARVGVGVEQYANVGAAPVFTAERLAQIAEHPEQ